MWPRVAGDRASPRVRSGLPRAPGPDGGSLRGRGGQRDPGDDDLRRRRVGRGAATGHRTTRREHRPAPWGNMARLLGCDVRVRRGGHQRDAGRLQNRSFYEAPARAVAGEGVPRPRRAHLPAEAKATAAVAHVRRRAREGRRRASANRHRRRVRVRHVKLRQVPSFARLADARVRSREGAGDRDGGEAGVAWPMGTGHRVDSSGCPGDGKRSAKRAESRRRDQANFVEMAMGRDGYRLCIFAGLV
mmetsp:Transcript_12834/g.54351  ORF Transcript_12834/g.54351 Transcript_12834/m.54351 type:complete len:245 (+) Transcript_12834:373-1107(+)